MVLASACEGSRKLYARKLAIADRLCIRWAGMQLFSDFSLRLKNEHLFKSSLAVTFEGRQVS